MVILEVLEGIFFFLGWGVIFSFWWIFKELFNHIGGFEGFNVILVIYILGLGILCVWRL